MSRKGQIGDKARTLVKKCLKDEVIKLVRNLKEEISKIHQET